MAPMTDADDPRLAPLRARARGGSHRARAGDRPRRRGRDQVHGAPRSRAGRDAAECRRIALGIAHSPLVKTAFFASDPNLGRIVCAIGNAAAPDLDPSRVSFWLDDVLVVENGGRAASYGGGRPARDEERRDRRPRRARPRRRVGNGLDLRFLARLCQHQRRLPQLTSIGPLASSPPCCCASKASSSASRACCRRCRRLPTGAQPHSAGASAPAAGTRGRAPSARDPSRRSRRDRRAEARDRRQHAAVCRRLAGEQRAARPARAAPASRRS